MKMNNPWLFLLLLNLLLFVQSWAEDQPDLYVVHFETGPAWHDDLPPHQQIGFGEHTRNLQQLRKAGVITFGARYEQYGMIFLTAENLKSAKNLLDADPGVKTGLFIYRVAKLNVFYSWKETTRL